MIPSLLVSIAGGMVSDACFFMRDRLNDELGTQLLRGRNTLWIACGVLLGAGSDSGTAEVVVCADGWRSRTDGAEASGGKDEATLLAEEAAAVAAVARRRPLMLRRARTWLRC